jgi:phytoene dehydrogenase-like protein
VTNRHDSRERFAASVVGGGLSGLAAGIELRRLGCSVLMLERRPVAGGLCGTAIVDGYEFVVACNDFGLGVERELRRLGVAAAFHRRSSRFHFEDRVVELPLGWRTSLSLLARARGGLRAWRSLRRQPEATLLDLAHFLESRALRDLVLSLAYPFGVAPSRCSPRSARRCLAATATATSARSHRWAAPPRSPQPAWLASRSWAESSASAAPVERSVRSQIECSC